MSKYLISNSKVVILIHGILSPSGRGQTDKLREYWESFGWVVVEHDYGFKGLFTLLSFLNKQIARDLKDKVNWYAERGNYVVCCAHSNGCLITNMAAEMGAKFKQAVYISPALDRGAEIADHVDWVHVWHSKTDAATALARLIPFAKTGDMGSVGYKGSSTKHINYDKASYGPSKSHLDIFKHLEIYAPIIIGTVEIKRRVDEHK